MRRRPFLRRSNPRISKEHRLLRNPRRFVQSPVRPVRIPKCRQTPHRRWRHLPLQTGPARFRNLSDMRSQSAARHRCNHRAPQTMRVHRQYRPAQAFLLPAGILPDWRLQFPPAAWPLPQQPFVPLPPRPPSGPPLLRLPSGLLPPRPPSGRPPLRLPSGPPLLRPPSGLLPPQRPFSPLRTQPAVPSRKGPAALRRCNPQALRTLPPPRRTPHPPAA